ncbi:MAG: hypothetical protein JF603_08215 [Acidobacteria bacterium]|nr:hypothetical protein [Acidobacteriota bacterium]
MLAAFVVLVAALEPLRRARVDHRLWAVPMVAGLAAISHELAALLHVSSPSARIAAGAVLSVTGNVRFVRDAPPVVLSPDVVAATMGYGLMVGAGKAALAGALAGLAVVCLNRRSAPTTLSRLAAVVVVFAGVGLAVHGINDV